MNAGRADGADGAGWDEAGWGEAEPGVLRLPSGRPVRGRGLRRPLDPAAPLPTYGVYLLGKEPPEVPWESRWLRWPDFRLPRDRADARTVLTRVWERAADPAERVEIACAGGRGRTGTALACLAVLDGVPPGEAVEFVRRNYDRHAVETPWQRRYVRGFGERGR
ncbi:protein-tyrosine phosphatase family protein [Streptomyces sp. CWNU-52B]|uniref:protein-tyrosine phosphatase family protein n=1 Tax=unclassified Streptomyces TaxID=2593676 RepID=UPI0039BF3154